MTLNEGDTVRITVDESNDPDGNTYSGHDFHVGEEVRFVGDTYTGKVDKFEHLDGHDYWYVNADEYEVITATPAEPVDRIAELEGQITEIVADKVHADAEIETLRREVKALRETLSYARERYEERDEPSSIGAFLEGARAGLRATI